MGSSVISIFVHSGRKDINYSVVFVLSPDTGYPLGNVKFTMERRWYFKVRNTFLHIILRCVYSFRRWHYEIGAIGRNNCYLVAIIQGWIGQVGENEMGIAWGPEREQEGAGRVSSDRCSVIKFASDGIWHLECVDYRVPLGNLLKIIVSILFTRGKTLYKVTNKIRF